MEFVIGILVGAFLYWVFAERKHASGSFIINMSDPMDETFKLEMYDGLGEIYSKKKIFLKVKIIGDNSQK